MTGERPDLVVLAAGTGTEVGKTWVSAQLLGRWRASGMRVAARKPAQSFDPGDSPTDAEVLGAAAGEPPAAVCRPERWYEVPMAPPMAAEVLGRAELTLARLLEGFAWPDDRRAIGLVEPAGGLRSPQALDADALDLAAALDVDHVLLVADAGLGTINSVRLGTAALAGRVVSRCTVVLNRYDPGDRLHAANRRWLEENDSLEVALSTADGLDELAERLASAARAAGSQAAADQPSGVASTT